MIRWNGRTLRYNAAELMRTRTGDVQRAVEAYAEVLAVAPDHEPSFAALSEVMRGTDAAQSIASARVLAPRFEGGGDYEQLLEVLDVLARSDDPTERIQSLRRAAEVADVGLGDSLRAFRFMGAATTAGLGDSGVVEMLRELERLGSAAEAWSEHATLLREFEPEIFDDELRNDIRLKIARLAQGRLSEPEIAQDYYQRILDDHPDHREALDALEKLFPDRGDTSGLLGILRRKIDLESDPSSRVPLLLQIAELSESSGDQAGAIDAYERVLSEAGLESAYQGLERLYASEQHWSELAGLLERRLDQNIGDSWDTRYRLGRVHEQHLSDLSRAVEEYRAALDTNGDHQPSIDRLAALMADEETSALAAEILEPVYTRRMDWPHVTEALEARLRAEGDLEARKLLLRRMGTIHEDYLEDLAGALEAYARLFREGPGGPGNLGHARTTRQESGRLRSPRGGLRRGARGDRG